MLIAAPHTTNWDFPYLLAFAEHFGMRISWLGKASLFRGPLGPIMRGLGGIPIERSRSENRVASMAKIFERYEDLGLVVPVEATRSRTDHWKSGFYYIALTAGVPVVMGFLDYARKRGGIGPAFMPTGDVARDMDAVRADLDRPDPKDLTAILDAAQKLAYVIEAGTMQDRVHPANADTVHALVLTIYSLTAECHRRREALQNMLDLEVQMTTDGVNLEEWHAVVDKARAVLGTKEG